MGDYLSKELTDIIFGFAGIYGVEVSNQTPNHVTKEMRYKCNDEIWILVEDNTSKDSIEYNYLVKCLCCGELLKLDDLNGYNVIIPRIKEKLIPYSEIRNYAKNLTTKYSAKLGRDITMEILYDKIVENYCAA